jgi:hypothetical protein
LWKINARCGLQSKNKRCALSFMCILTWCRNRQNSIYKILSKRLPNCLQILTNDTEIRISQRIVTFRVIPRKIAMNAFQWNSCLFVFIIFLYSSTQAMQTVQSINLGPALNWITASENISKKKSSLCVIL